MNKSIFGFKWQRELQLLKTLIETQQEIRLMQGGCDTTRIDSSHRVTVIPYVKYVAVDVGFGGRYMIEKETGKIFGIRGYGRVNRKKQYGTLETILNYHWGFYTAIPIDSLLAGRDRILAEGK